MGLCDGAMFVDRVRSTPLVAARSFRRFSLRDIAIASGEQAPLPGVEAPKSSVIEGAFTEVPLPELQGVANAVSSALESLAAIEAFVAEKVGASNGTNFAKLSDVLKAASKILATQLARRGVGVEAAADGAAGEDAAGPGGARPSISGDVRSRDDVVRVLDRVCSYYERYEPSSPIPLLVQRAKRLVSASFIDIMRDLAPDGMSQIENLKGKERDAE